MAADEPPYLTIGTDVSARYKGAFCEAKIKKVNRMVKCKVTFKNNLGSAMVLDDQIKGVLRIGAEVEARHPDKHQFVGAVINKLQDYSQYTVVFDDGDETTLRRTSLCLKSGRHFAESPTLDQFPLTNPEHFGTPVVGSSKLKRKRRSTMNSATLDYYSSEEEAAIPKKTKIGRGKEKDPDVGKVVCIDFGDRRKKDNWYPGLIVPSTSQEAIRVNPKDEYLIRSFKDGKYYQVSKRDTREFTREVCKRVESNTLKTAVDKALLYFDKGELPPHWDKTLHLGIDMHSADDDSHDTDTDSSDDEPSEEKDRFVAQLYKFMDERGTPINKGPTVGNRDLNLYKLFKVVHKMGGCNRVTNQNKWKTVYAKMGLPPSNPSGSIQIKQAYKRFLHSFEDFNRKLGCTMVNNTRSTRGRHRSDRNFIITRNRDQDGASPKVRKESRDKSVEKKEDKTKSQEKKEKEKVKTEKVQVKNEKVPIKNEKKDVKNEKSSPKGSRSPKTDEKPKVLEKKKTDIPNLKEEVKKEDKPRLARSQTSIRDKGKESVGEQKESRIDRARTREDIKKQKNENPEKKKETRLSTKLDQEKEKREKLLNEKKNTEESKEVKERSAKDKCISKDDKTLIKDKKFIKSIEKNETTACKGRKFEDKNEKNTNHTESKPIKERKFFKRERNEPKEKADQSTTDEKKSLLKEKKGKLKDCKTLIVGKVKITDNITSTNDEKDVKSSLLAAKHEKSDDDDDDISIVKSVMDKKEDIEDDDHTETDTDCIITEVKQGKHFDTATMKENSGSSHSGDDDEYAPRKQRLKRGWKSEEKDEKSLTYLTDSDNEDYGSGGEDKCKDEKPIEVGDKVKVKYGRGRTPNVYEAKVLKIEMENGEKKYFVHYAGWNTRYDEWVKRNFIVENVSDKNGSLKQKKEFIPKSTVSPSVAKKAEKRLLGSTLSSKLSRKNSTSSTNSSTISVSRATRSEKNRLQTSPFVKGLQPKKRTRKKSGVSITLTDTSQESESDDEDDDMLILDTNEYGDLADALEEDNETKPAELKDLVSNDDEDEKDEQKCKVHIMKDAELCASETETSMEDIKLDTKESEESPSVNKIEKEVITILDSPMKATVDSTSTDDSTSTSSKEKVAPNILEDCPIVKELKPSLSEISLKSVSDVKQQPRTLSELIEKKYVESIGQKLKPAEQPPIVLGPTISTDEKKLPIATVADDNMPPIMTFMGSIKTENKPQILKTSSPHLKPVETRAVPDIKKEIDSHSVVGNFIPKHFIENRADVSSSPKIKVSENESIKKMDASPIYTLPLPDITSKYVRTDLTPSVLLKNAKIDMYSSSSPLICRSIPSPANQKNKAIESEKLMYMPQPLPNLKAYASEPKVQGSTNYIPISEIKKAPLCTVAEKGSAFRKVVPTASKLHTLCDTKTDAESKPKLAVAKDSAENKKDIFKNESKAVSAGTSPLKIPKYFSDFNNTTGPSSTVTVKEEKVFPKSTSYPEFQPIKPLAKEESVPKKELTAKSVIPKISNMPIMKDDSENKGKVISQSVVLPEPVKTTAHASVITFASCMTATIADSNQLINNDKKCVEPKKEAPDDTKTIAVKSNVEESHAETLETVDNKHNNDNLNKESLKEPESPSPVSLATEHKNKIEVKPHIQEDRSDDNSKQILLDNIQKCIADIAIDNDIVEMHVMDKNIDLSEASSSNKSIVLSSDEVTKEATDLLPAKDTTESISSIKIEDSKMSSADSFSGSSEKEQKIHAHDEQQCDTHSGDILRLTSLKKEAKKKKCKTSKKWSSSINYLKQSIKCKEGKFKSKKKLKLQGECFGIPKDSELKVKSKKFKKNKNKKRFSCDSLIKGDIGEDGSKICCFEKAKRKEKRKREDKKFFKSDLKHDDLYEFKGESSKKDKKKGRKKDKFSHEKKMELLDKKLKRKKKSYMEDNFDSESEKESSVKLGKKKKKEKKKAKESSSSDDYIESKLIPDKETCSFAATSGEQEKVTGHDMSFLLCEEKVPASPETNNPAPEDTSGSSSFDDSNNRSPSSDEDRTVQPVNMYRPGNRENINRVNKHSTDACAVLDNTPPTTPSSTESIPSSSPSHDRESFLQYTESTQSGKESGEGDAEFESFPCDSHRSEVMESEEYRAATTLAFAVSRVVTEKHTSAHSLVKRQKSEDDDYSPTKRKRRTKRSFLPPESPKHGQPRTKGLGSHYSKGDSCETYDSSGASAVNMSSPPHGSASSMFSSFSHRTSHLTSETSSMFSGKASKINFCVSLQDCKDPEKRIAMLQEKMSELRKCYASLKAEVATIDRRRKKARKKIKEAAASVTVNISTHSEDAQNFS